LPSCCRARAARSASDWRLSGRSVSWTSSQASALMTARSSGGKGGLAPSAGPVVEGEAPRGPAPAPLADGVGLHPAVGRSPGVRQGRALGQGPGQLGTLGELEGDGPPTHEGPGVVQERRGETRLVSRGRPGHGMRPEVARAGRTMTSPVAYGLALQPGTYL